MIIDERLEMQIKDYSRKKIRARGKIFDKKANKELKNEQRKIKSIDKCFLFIILHWYHMYHSTCI